MSTILAIDDRPDNLLSLSALLKSTIPGCNVVTALSGHRGIKMAKTDNPDTILLDVHMPEMDGFEVCKILKSDPLTKHIPVIMLTAVHTGVDSRVKGLESGADAFLVKPLDQFELSAQVKAMLRIKHAEDIMRRESSVLEQQVADRTAELVKNRDQLILEIEERRHAEEKLKESQYRLNAFLDNSPVGSGIWDRDFRYVYINNALQKINGPSVEEHIGSTIEEVIPKIAPVIKPMFEKILSNSKPFLNIEVHGEVPSKPGKTSQYLVSYFPISAINGKPQFIGGVVVDITDHKQALETLKENEEKFRSIFENSPLGIVHFDKFGVVTACNENLCKIIGSKKDKVIGLDTMKSLKDVEMRNSISKALSGKKSQYEGEYLSVTGGVSTQVRAKYAPIISNDGEATGALGILEDVSEQFSAEQEKLRLESQLLQLQKNEAIGALAGGIAHDFNNILFPILGFAEMLEDDVSEDSPLRESVDEIIIGAKRAKELVKQILTFSRQTEQELKPLKPQYVIKEVIQLIKATLPTTIEIKQDIDPECGTIMADPTQIHQVAMNLITNSYHAMLDSGGVLSITLRNIDFKDNICALDLDAGPHILLSVKDTGIGMDQTTIEKIFNPYFSTKPVSKGTGLGLSVVLGIVKKYGGDIEVKSTLGQGSVFNVYLPVYKSKSVSEKDLKKGIDPQGTEKILLVDDERPILRLERKMLERLGYQIDVAENGEDALNKVKPFPDKYDLIITDMTMPKMTGDTLAQEIKKINPDVPIIICTGFSEKITPERASDIGINAILTKPIIKTKLARAIRNILD